MTIRASVLSLITCAMCPTQAAAESTAAEVFRQLSSLAGVWEGKFSNGRAHGVTYKLTAGDSVLVETWSLAPGRESMTLYHMDGDTLIATHYCPAGNQPTLQLAAPSADTDFVFEFRSATNLVQPIASHQHQFEIRLLNKDSFWRSETYVEKGEGTSEAVTYTRRVDQQRGD
ncbi:MAG: hypothetical protein ACREV5_04990 [Steroidobacter sp.]